LEIGDALRVGDLPEIEGVTYTDDPTSTVVSITVPALEVEPEEEAEELAEGEEAEGAVAEGEVGEETAEGGAEGGAGE
jgi:hypothetical protein